MTPTYASIKKDPSPKELRQFGLIFLVGFGLLGLWQHVRAHRPTVAMVLWSLAVVVFLLSFVRPIGRRLYWLWMALGITIGRVTGPLVLGLVWIVVFVPLALVFRLLGRDALGLRIDPDAKSHWQDYPKNDDPAQFFRQY